MLASEQVIIQAPMSYTGSAKRIWRLGSGGWRTLLIAVVALAWVGVTLWYLLFGILLVPYRLIRRGERKRRREALQHRELLAAYGVIAPPAPSLWAEPPEWAQ